MYKYDIHTHTKLSSACAHLTGEEIVTKYKDRGFTGIIITDHFVNGSSHANIEAPWDERVDILMSGYKDAKKYGDEMGLDVFFGFEYPWWGMDYLVYGIDEQMIKEHPELLSEKIRDVFSLIHSLGGIVIQAHPMREREYIHGIYLHTDYIDGVEVYNGTHHVYNTSEYDERAKRYADDHPHLIQTAGSDTHGKTRPGCMIFDEKIRSVSHFIELLRARNYRMGE